MQTYETERVRLRGWLQADLVPFAAINAAPEVTEFLPAAMRRAESDGFVDRIRMQFLERGFGVFAAEEREPGEFMGFVGLNVPSFEAKFTPCVEVGWRLARAHWGKGYATEAAREALRIGFAIHTA
jgi:RimJ/RimL family protein N-acetyltransferase